MQPTNYLRTALLVLYMSTSCPSNPVLLGVKKTEPSTVPIASTDEIKAPDSPAESKVRPQEIRKSPIERLPNDLLLNNVLPHLDDESLRSVSQTCRYFRKETTGYSEQKALTAIEGDHKALLNAPVSSQRDVKFILKAAEKNSKVLLLCRPKPKSSSDPRYFPPDHRRHHLEIGIPIQDYTDCILGDKKFLKELATRKPKALRYATPVDEDYDLRSPEAQICWQRYEGPLKYSSYPPSLPYDLVKENIEAVAYIDPEFLQGPNFIKMLSKEVARDYKVMEHAPEFLKKHKKLLLRVIKKDYRVIEFAHPDLFSDKAFMAEAKKIDPRCLILAAEALLAQENKAGEQKQG